MFSQNLCKENSYYFEKSFYLSCLDFENIFYIMPKIIYVFVWSGDIDANLSRSSIWTELQFT